MWSIFAGWIDALGRPLVSAIRISQVVAFSRMQSVHLNPQIEGTEIVCPQFSGGRFCQVVARTGLTALLLEALEKRKGALYNVCTLGNCKTSFRMFKQVQCIQAKISKTLDKRNTLIFAANCTEQNWAHPKDTTLPRIYEVEMQLASLLFYLANPNLGAFWGVRNVIVRQKHSIPDVLSKLAERTERTQYPAWSCCRSSADVPRWSWSLRLIATAARL